MTDKEIQKYIEENMYHPDGNPMIDVQAFYEGAKWYRNMEMQVKKDKVSKRPNTTSSLENFTKEEKAKK